MRIQIPNDADLPVSVETLITVIASYVPRAKSYGFFTSGGAALRCGEATENFTHFLIEAIPDIDLGQVNTLCLDFNLIGDRALFPIPVGSYREQHIFTLVGNCAVDWTAKQFVPQAPCPLLFTVPVRAF